METFCTLDLALAQEDRHRQTKREDGEVSPSLLAAIAETTKRIDAAFPTGRKMSVKLKGL